MNKHSVGGETKTPRGFGGGYAWRRGRTGIPEYLPPHVWDALAGGRLVAVDESASNGSIALALEAAVVRELSGAQPARPNVAVYDTAEEAIAAFEAAMLAAGSDGSEYDWEKAQTKEELEAARLESDDLLNALWGVFPRIGKRKKRDSEDAPKPYAWSWGDLVVQLHFGPWSIWLEGPGRYRRMDVCPRGAGGASDVIGWYRRSRVREYGDGTELECQTGRWLSDCGDGYCPPARFFADAWECVHAIERKIHAEVLR